jgi:homoserine trans-succinylase
LFDNLINDKIRYGTKKEEAFKRLFGVNRETFEKMKSVLQKEYDELYWQV